MSYRRISGGIEHEDEGKIDRFIGDFGRTWK